MKNQFLCNDKVMTVTEVHHMGQLVVVFLEGPSVHMSEGPSVHMFSEDTWNTLREGHIPLIMNNNVYKSVN